MVTVVVIDVIISMLMSQRVSLLGHLVVTVVVIDVIISMLMSQRVSLLGHLVVTVVVIDVIISMLMSQRVSLLGHLVVTVVVTDVIISMLMSQRLSLLGHLQSPGKRERSVTVKTKPSLKATTHCPRHTASLLLEEDGGVRGLAGGGFGEVGGGGGGVWAGDPRVLEKRCTGQGQSDNTGRSDRLLITTISR